MCFEYLPSFVKIKYIGKFLIGKVRKATIVNFKVMKKAGPHDKKSVGIIFPSTYPIFKATSVVAISVILNMFASTIRKVLSVKLLLNLNWINFITPNLL